MNTDNLIKGLKDEILLLIKEKYGEGGAEIKEGVKDFIDQSKQRLVRWALLFESDQLSKEEFALLINSQKDLFVIEALYKAGISKISLGHFKNSIVSLVISKIIEALNARKSPIMDIAPSSG